MSDTNAGTGTPSNTGEPTTTTDSTAATAAGTTESTATSTDAGTKTDDTTATNTEVPESYDLQMPDGIELDKAAADEFTAIAKELKLDQTAAQKFADIGAKMAQRQIEAHAKLVETWTEQVKTDKELGGDKLDQNLGIARKAIDTFGSPELKELLNSTGLGNHPEVVKLAFKVGKAISEDGFVAGKAPGSVSNDPAKKLFPNMN
jgi:hypothetical protein